MKAGLRNALANMVLVAVSLALTYAVLEVVFFRLMLPGLPLTWRLYLPDRADFFLQVSKSQYVPHDYLALVGDSYAQGMGDWLLSQNGKGARPYHSADVIHDILGRDVASFGRASAGSAEGMVLRVTRILGDRYCYLFPAIEAPKRFLVHFTKATTSMITSSCCSIASAPRAMSCRRPSMPSWTTTMARFHSGAAMGIWAIRSGRSFNFIFGSDCTRI